MDQARLIASGTAYCLANPPGGIGAKMATTAVVKFFGGMHQCQVSLLDEIYERDAGTGIAACNSNDQAQVCLDELVACQLISFGGLSRELNFLCMCEATKSTNVTQVALKSIFRTCGPPGGGCASMLCNGGKLLQYLGFAPLFRIIRFAR